MEFIVQTVSFTLHIDFYLTTLIADYGTLVYAIVFLFILCETGRVINPFLPGDSLLFALGALAAQGALSLTFLFTLLIIAAVGGDAINYSIGKTIGTRLADRYVKKEYLARTENFYKHYGAKTIIIARFVPIVRTLAPFVAGVGTMRYRIFATYNVIGGTAWVSLFLFGGYFFGGIPVVKNNFSLIILGIIVVSLLPPVIEYIQYRRKSQPLQ